MYHATAASVIPVLEYNAKFRVGKVRVRVRVRVRARVRVRVRVRVRDRVRLGQCTLIHTLGSRVVRHQSQNRVGVRIGFMVGLGLGLGLGLGSGLGLGGGLLPTTSHSIFCIVFF